MQRDTFCSFCGVRYAEPLAYPRSCAGCGTQVWSNPVPVVVVLLPIEDAGRTGLLVIRRAIPPAIGKLALVGGFLEDHEDWQHGGAREVREETGVVVDPATLEPFWYASSAPRPNRVLLFALAPPRPAAALPAFAANERSEAARGGDPTGSAGGAGARPHGIDTETSERGVIFGPDGLDDVFAFSTHIDAARRYFAARGVTGGHAFVAR